MVIQGLAFYLFAIIALASAFRVVCARNPVHAVLWLILTFLNSAGLFVLLGAELLGMILVTVYVGAVAVLFLFVVMMLDLNATPAREGWVRYRRLGITVAAVLCAELVVVLVAPMSPTVGLVSASPMPPLSQLSNAKALGSVLYTDYIYPFQAAGLLLLVAMIGSIVLTHRTRPGVRKQKIADQIARGRTIRIKSVASREGI